MTVTSSPANCLDAAWRSRRSGGRLAKYEANHAGETPALALRPSLFDARQNVRDDLRLRLRALRAAVVEAHAYRAGFHVATADDEHRVDAQLFRVGDLRLERRRAEIRIHTHHVRAQFGHDGLGVIDQRF